MHVSLIQLREQIRSLCLHQDEESFPHAFRHGVKAMVEARRQADAPEIVCRFKMDSVCRDDESLRKSYSTCNLNDFLAFWQKSRVERGTKNRRAILFWQAFSQSKEERLKAIQKKQEERRKLSEEMQRRCVERRQKAKDKNRQAKKKKCEWLFKEILHAQLDMRKTWDVEELPAGLELASFQSQDDVICCVLRLADGSTRHGPFRTSITEAQADLSDLQALQRARGDQVACIELRRRDADAMTGFFRAAMT
eukprot:TRINITY_DN22131_c0_g1_i1.p1 TRINITY_DN22131_c0_g1~~TRINITY_DN22131_c0_g1_i1.p1  ORF type:complete len:251 (-),score=46.82 TRINITY_DN22131_c0_g1_i1:33-785(-)